MKTTLILFCQNSAANAARPGQQTNNVQLIAVRAAHNGGVDQNENVFVDQNGNAHLQISGANDAFNGLFKAGKKYRITAEEIE